MKRCSKCKKEKPASEFYRHKITRDGLRPECKECQTEINKKWLNKNRERYRKYHKEYYRKNKEYYKEYCREWYQRTKEQRIAYRKKWREENKDRTRFLCLRRWAMKNNAEGSHTFKEWQDLKKKYNYICPCCGKSEPEITLTEDHITPLSKGGTDYIKNIQPLCKKCNSKKHTKIIKYKIHG